MSILSKALSDASLDFTKQIKTEITAFAFQVARDHFGVDAQKYTSPEAQNLFGLVLMSRFHQKDGKGGGHVLLSAKEAFETVQNLSAQDQIILQDIENDLNLATQEKSVTPSAIVDIALWRWARDSEKHINFPDVQAPEDAFLAVRPFQDHKTGAIHAMTVVDPALFRIRTIVQEKEFFITNQLQNCEVYGPRINAHDIIHIMAQQFAPEGELSITHYDFYVPNSLHPLTYYTSNQRDISFELYKKKMKPFFSDATYQSATHIEKVNMLADRASVFVKSADFSLSEALFSLGGKAPSAERFELGAAYLESQILVRADPHDLDTPETHGFKTHDFNKIPPLARLKKLAEFWDPEKNRAGTIALPDGREIPYPAQKMTALQENAILAQIAKTLVYEEYLQTYLDSSDNTHKNSAPLHKRAAQNLRKISDIENPDGSSIAQFMSNTIVSGESAEKFRQSLESSDAESLTEYFYDMQHYLKSRSKIHFDPAKPTLFSALKTFGKCQTAQDLRACSEKILAGEIPAPVPTAKFDDLTTAQKQLIQSLRESQR
jgi:hypothetical protein